MKDYDFTLKFNLQQPKVDPSVYVEALYAGGCDDALIGIGKKGYISLNFIREAPFAYEAMSTAIADAKRVIPHASLIEAAPDYAGLTDAAKILGCTRQNVRKLIVTGEPSSPPPIYEGTPSIWHLAEILDWLREVKAYPIDSSLIEVAKMKMDLNNVKGWQTLEPTYQETIKALVS
ncbi:DNA-binding protein [Leptolyngbya sp. CCY15150]|uniref:helix-turn-helix transcriptional regulator n=1 Tax=Leptolyngbya sp. CCY15150 TaxID=2767772 RepID=UPI0019502228|nr:DNA-binding protein [Leptolyngbya sp. CCY15150]